MALLGVDDSSLMADLQAKSDGLVSGLVAICRSIYIHQTRCGPMPIVLAALVNIGGALCSTPHSLADAHYESALQ